MNKRWRHSLEYAGVKLTLGMAGSLPLGLACRIGAVLGWKAFEVVRVRRRVSIENVMQATGADRRSATRIARHAYMNQGRSLMEFAAFRHLDRQAVLKRIRFEGFEHVDEALKLGRGLVLFGGHVGNWELEGAGIVASDYPIHFLVGEQTNRRVDDVMNDLRRRQGIGIIPRGLALKRVLRTLRDNQIVAMLADQDAGNQGVFVDYLGRPASAARGPALFAIRQRCPIVVAAVRRESRDRHVASISPLLWPNPDLDEEEAVVDLIQRYTDVLADFIRRFPHEYFWAHRRWKTQPARSQNVNTDS